MRKTVSAVSLVAVGAGLVIAATPAGAAGSHLATARADWVRGSHVAAAVESRWWTAASRELHAYGHRYDTERHALATLVSIPLTDTTPAQRTAATRSTRTLNSFFHTPGLYGVAPAPSHLTLARRQWVRSAAAPAAAMDVHLDAARAQLAHYGARYAVQRGQLQRLAALPLTGLTPRQVAAAHRLVEALDAFFHTHV